MTLNGWIQILLFCAVVLALVKPLGGYMTRVFAGEHRLPARPIERAALRARRRRRARGAALADLRARHARRSTSPASSSSTRCSACRACCRSTRPGWARSPPDLAFNTAVSFVTNTNWQNYGGESTMSYLVQMAGLTVQNFVSAATGIALAVALIRGFARASARSVGNFWVDLTRATLYVLLPICVVFALVPRLAGRAADPRRLRRGDDARGRASRRSRVGPVASQVAIKMLGTNGGGFFNANSAHPFENPTRALRTSSRWSRSSRSARRSPTSSAAWSATSARAGRSSPPWACCSSPASPSPTGPRPPATRSCTRSGSRAATWRARRSASASSPRRSSP